MLPSFLPLVISDSDGQVMHAGPSPVYHRDIRSPNIIKRYESHRLFLVDWSDASTTPTRAAPHRSKEGHSPRVREDNHGAEVDIWGVAYYLKSLTSTSLPEGADKLTIIAERWMEDGTITAEAALDEIKV